MQPKDTLTKPQNIEPIAWIWMRYSAILLIPLVLGHVLLLDVGSGAQQISLSLIKQRWEMPIWRIYDAFLLLFGLAHGINGLRQILIDFIPSSRGRTWMAWGLLLVWTALSLVGLISLAGGIGAGF